MPARTAPKYSIDSVSAFELTIQPAAMSTPPKATISFGPSWAPSLSTIQPSIGVSQVSSATNILKATWIAATDQPCALFIGPTNSVQPYCRLAIMIMQMIPAISWVHLSRLIGCEAAPPLAIFALLGFPVSIVAVGGGRVRHARFVVKQTQFGACEFTPADSIFHDDDEERDGANERQRYCHVGNQRNVPAPSNARPH